MASFVAAAWSWARLPSFREQHRARPGSGRGLILRATGACWRGRTDRSGASSSPDVEQRLPQRRRVLADRAIVGCAPGDPAATVENRLSAIASSARPRRRQVDHVRPGREATRTSPAPQTWTPVAQNAATADSRSVRQLPLERRIIAAPCTSGLVEEQHGALAGMRRE
jgi:hypothetical protein